MCSRPTLLLLIGIIQCGALISLLACSRTAEAPAPADLDAGEDADAPVLPPTDAGAACNLPTYADAQGFSPSYTMLSSGSLEQDEAFYLLTLFEEVPGALAALQADPVLSAASGKYDALLRAAPQTCGTDVACYAGSLQLSATDTQAIASELPTALAALLPILADTHMRPSGLFELFAGGTDAAMLSAAWNDTAAALSASYAGYAATLSGADLENVVTSVIAANPQPMPFFGASLSVALGALTAGGDDEATLYAPLGAGENAAVLAAIPSIDWGAYPYTVILVPGQGPTTLSTPLDPTGQERCDIAAIRFQAHYAPILAVSGGHVHPPGTPYCEALEMKQYLMSQKGIPESAIMVDPYARTTSTNIRNVTRELYRYGIPTNRAALVTSDQFQSLEIGYPNGFLSGQAESTLLYLPYRVLSPLTEYDTCLLPTPLSLTGNGRDPLDP